MSLPPLVEPADELSLEEYQRYSRHITIPEMGSEGQKRLKNARVLVVGAGGLGSPTLLYLAAAGIGTIGIVDFDIVEESNLQRQIIHTVSHIGMPKVDSARDALRDLNPLVAVETHQIRLQNDNVGPLFNDYDLIIDGTDNFATRYLINDAAILAGKPYVWGSVYRFEGQVSVFWEAAPNGRGINYRDLYPCPPAEQVPSCAQGGVFGVLCASIASIMATEVIKLITGIGDPLLGRLLIYNALEMNYRTISIRKDPHVTPITELIDYAKFCSGSSQKVGQNMDEKVITPVELKQLLDSGKPIALVDVREPDEYKINRIKDAVLVPKSTILSGEGLSQIPTDRLVVLYCKGGVRSAEALEAVQQAGFTNVMHLQGGITQWAKQIEPDMVMY